MVAIEQAIKSLSSEVVHAISSQAETAEDQQNTKDDLNAQQDMAFWALCMVGVSLGQLAATIVGIALVYKTLQSTRDAVGEAKQATKAANAAVKVTEDSAERQLRAYVIPETVTIDALEVERPVITTIVKNSGQTPAYEVLCIATCKIMVNGREDFQYSGEQIGPMIVAAQGTFTATNVLKQSVINDHKDALVQGTEKAYLYGLLSYIDCFKVKRTCKFRYVLYVRKRLEDGVMILCSEGNEAD